jgi:hypothetical protein
MNKKPLWFEREVEQHDHLLLHLRFQVNEEVAAADEAQLGERRVGDQVLNGEGDRFPHLLVDLVGVVVHLGEKAGQPFRRHVRGNAIGIQPLTYNMVCSLCGSQG